MKKPRVMYILSRYPQISETYIKTEIEAIRDTHDVAVVAQKPADIPFENHHPFTTLSRPEALREAIEDFKPQVLHTHWIHLALLLHELSEQTGVPFTVRTHSFDLLQQGGRRAAIRKLLSGVRQMVPRARQAAALAADDRCLGMLAFPFARPWLEQAGTPSEKLYDCYPVVAYEKFYDTSPNGNGIMNVGACLPKKNMEDFLHVAALVPERPYNLYALGYKVDELAKRAAEIGSPVNFIPPVQPDDMPREYKKHEWLVYTASRAEGTVGWPLAVAEAQASGVGVCLQNVRPDVKDYVGRAGFVFDSPADAARIISRPFPSDLREEGFEQAKRSDIRGHISVLTELWNTVAQRRSV